MQVCMQMRKAHTNYLCVSHLSHYNLFIVDSFSFFFAIILPHQSSISNLMQKKKKKEIKTRVSTLRNFK
jgi:hypothetical protein